LDPSARAEGEIHFVPGFPLERRGCAEECGPYPTGREDHDFGGVGQRGPCAKKQGKGPNKNREGRIRLDIHRHTSFLEFIESLESA
jgi:hypothetical protein